MPTFDLFAASHNPSPEKVVELCESYSKWMPFADWSVYEPLTVAERLAEQMLGHYGSLASVQRALDGVSRPDRAWSETLPKGVLEVFLHACQRDHESVGIIFDEILSVYEFGPTQEDLSVFQNTMRGCHHRTPTKPAMLSESGIPNFNPCAYHLVHPHHFSSSISMALRTGESRIRPLLNAYEGMDEGSRILVDKELRQWVYQEWLADNDPVRQLLVDKLDVVAEAEYRMKNLFKCYWDITPGSEFQIRLKKCFDLVDTLSDKQRGPAIHALKEALDICTDEYEVIELETSKDPVSCMRRVLECAEKYGFDGLAYISRHKLEEGVSQAQIAKQFIEVGRTKTNVTTALVWMEAVVLHVDDDTLLAYDLGLDNLVWIAQAKNSQRIRNVLLESDKGRDRVLGQDLGL